MSDATRRSPDAMKHDSVCSAGACAMRCPSPRHSQTWGTRFVGGRPGEDVLQTLIGLSGDSEDDVRDWATFALGTLADADEPELRDALAARLDDPDEATRLEAVHGLAVRGDPRAAEPAREVLAAHGDAEGEGVWTRHLLAETASHIDGS